MSNNTPSEWYLFSCGPDKACCYTLDGAYKTELSMNTLYELCTSHMQYFITLLIHQNFNPCITPTSLMDMPIPIGTFHNWNISYIHKHTHIYIYVYIYIPLCFVKQSVFCPLIFVSSFSIWQAKTIWSVADLLWYNTHWLLATVCLYMVFTLRKKQKHVWVHFKSKKYFDN